MADLQTQRLTVTTQDGLKLTLPNEEGVVAGSPVLGQYLP